MIDLSKAYKGQIITLLNGTTHEIKDIHLDSNGWYDIDDFAYYKDGTYSTNDRGGDIISIQDSIQVQVARLEGEIEAYENILLIKPSAATFDFILQKRADAKAQLLTLQNNQ